MISRRNNGIGVNNGSNPVVVSIHPYLSGSFARSHVRRDAMFWSWVFWGVCMRVAVCVHGHWLIGYFAHNDTYLSSRRWHVTGSGVQGYNVKLPALDELLPVLSFGESWHNNHHSFPGSAKLGLAPNEMDVGYHVLKTMERVGLVWNIRELEDLPPRHELTLLPHGVTVQEDAPNSLVVC